MTVLSYDHTLNLRGEMGQGSAWWRWLGLLAVPFIWTVPSLLVVGLVIGKRRDYFREKAQIDRQFDEGRGVDTGGVQSLFDLTIAGPNALHGNSHVAVDPAEFAAGVDALGIDPSAYTFVDLGSGKGRALLLAAERGFRQVIGVEFAMELHEVAMSNVAAFASECPDLAGCIQLFNADATGFAVPLTALVIYLFNSFDAVVCREVARKVMESWKAAPRPIHVFYMNPVEANAWIEAGWRLRTRARPYALLEPDDSAKGVTAEWSLDVSGSSKDGAAT